MRVLVAPALLCDVGGWGSDALVVGVAGDGGWGAPGLGDAGAGVRRGWGAPVLGVAEAGGHRGWGRRG